MALPLQTQVLLKAARQLSEQLKADAILLLTETDLDWDEVTRLLATNNLLVAAQQPALTKKLQTSENITVLDIDPGPTPTQERMSLALLEAVAQEKIRSGAHVIVLYNGIGVGDFQPEHIDSISVIHLGEHLERLSAQDLPQAGYSTYRWRCSGPWLTWRLKSAGRAGRASPSAPCSSSATPKRW